ncbi:MAG: hypothetical protein ACXWCO_00755 [Caldimonas sp.]
MIKFLRAAAAAALLVGSLAAPEIALAQASGTSPVPAVTGCGTGPTVTAFEDNGFVYRRVRALVTTGTGTPTGCTITFAQPFKVTVVCSVEDQSANANLTSFTLSNSALVLTTSAASSQKIAVMCDGL